MGRAATGQVLVRPRKRGDVFALRFRAYGERQYLTLGSAADGWTWRRAEDELANVLADVRRGIWRPPEQDPRPEPPAVDPTFHAFATEWLEGRSADGLADRTLEDYRWSLSCHLLPYFAAHRLRAITKEEVDRYKRSKVRERELQLVERPLANGSINKTLKHLAAVLELAVEYGYIATNPARGRRRRLRADATSRASMTVEQVAALLRAAGEHRPLLATAIMAGGLRVSELTNLRWRDVDLAGGWLDVTVSKTAAGTRRVDLAPQLLDELKTWKASAKFTDPNDYVFPTKVGTRRDRNTLRTRILYPAIRRANAGLVDAGRPAIAEQVTFHSLRRTYATLAAEQGVDQRYTMRQIGHTSAALTLEVYTDIADRKHRGNVRLGELLLGDGGGRPASLGS